MKKCPRCKRKLNNSYFNRDRTKKDGLHFCCRECQSEYHKEWRMRRLRAGLCYDCGKSRPAGMKRFCLDCLKKREGMNEIYEQKRKVKGICRQCNKNPIDYTRSKLHCTNCLDRRNLQAYKNKIDM